jgi:hypothetical protein
MFAPLGFVPGLTPEQVNATQRRGGEAQIIADGTRRKSGLVSWHWTI